MLLLAVNISPAIIKKQGTISTSVSMPLHVLCQLALKFQ
jgi:hypothetical protein